MMKLFISILFTSLLVFSCGQNQTSKNTDNSSNSGTNNQGNSGNAGNKNDPGKTDPGKTDPGKTDPGKTDPGKTDPNKKPEEPKNFFSKGPYGTSPRDTIGDFKVKTLAGDLEFKKVFNPNDNYLFVYLYPNHNYSQALWNSKFDYFLKYGPRNFQLFFISYGDDFKKSVENQQTRFLKELSGLGFDQKTQDYFKERVHFVAEKATDIKGSIGDIVRKQPQLFFAVDRFQKIRNIGAPSYMGSAPSFQFLTFELEFFNFEFNREKNLNSKAEVIKALEDFPYKGGWGSSHKVEVKLPSKDDLKKYDTLLVDLTMHCQDHLEKNCPDWDHTTRLYLCREVDSKEKCDLEFARWITTYKREGRWVTDISPMLALIQAGGKQKFRFASHNKNTISLNFRFSNEGKGMRPVAFKQLFGGGSFNQEYNKKYKEIKFEKSAKHKKIQSYFLITGHGWGKTVNNCAEFCNHVHFFTVNEKDKYMRSHSIAGTNTGCLKQVNKGVVPNQSGTWATGRAGWCPGMDVIPWQEDLTKALKSGENSINYKALFNGQTYTPVNRANAPKNAIPPSITMNSYLIFWE